MTGVLSWYKLLQAQAVADGQNTNQIGRVGLHGGSTTKNGSDVELAGFHYDAKPEVKKFKLCRKHPLRREFARVDDRATQFEALAGYGHVAWTEPFRLRSGSRVLNRTWRFEDYLGSEPSGAVRTTQFGHLEVDTVQLRTSGIAHPPFAVVTMAVLAKPVKDPDVDVFLLLPGRREPERASLVDRGYRDLNDLVTADLRDETPEDWREEAESGIPSYDGDVRVTVSPERFHIPDGGTGSCTVSLEISGPARFSFAVQAVPVGIPERTSGAEENDPTDENLIGVMVSDVHTLELREEGQIVVI